jgi:uncharacterized protein YeaO (DUF488 family)
MKFTKLLKSIILEQSRFEILFDALTKPSQDKEGKTVKPKLSKEEFIKLVTADPTTRMNDVDIETASKKELGNIKAGKYVNWLIKNYLTPKTEVTPDHPKYKDQVKEYKDRFMEDLYKVTDDLKKFERFKGKLSSELKDINKLDTDKLYDAVKDFDLTLATTTKSERKSAPVHPGAKLRFDGDEWRVIEISDKGAAGKEAACFYGGNQVETRWCTSAPGLSWFDRYIKDGPLYVIYRPNDPKVSAQTGLPVERYQFHFQSNQFMDKDDRQQNLVELLNGPMSELKDFFKPEFAKGLTVGGEKLEIDSFTSGAVGKFIALYGLDELFESIPETITEFIIKNRENNGIIIKIPENISKFQNLQMMLLDNCIDRIPDSICNLKKLTLISLINNKGLKTIPECIADLPELLFLSVKGSDNVQLPEKIKQTGVELGNGMWDFEK